MNGKRIYRNLALFGAACCLTACLSNAAQAAEVVLHAHLTGKAGMEGKVQYVLHENKIQTFEAFMKGAKPGQFLIVAVRRKADAFKLAWVRADKLGKASLGMSTAFGHSMPFLKTGDVVEVWTGKSLMLKGQLQ